MRIAFASADWGTAEDGTPLPGGSGWARVHQIADRMADAGHRTAIGSKMGVRPDGVLTPMGHDMKPVMPDPEIVVVQRWMHEHAAELTRAARAAGQVILHDVDDWFWGLDPANRAYRNTSRRNDPAQNRHHYRAAVAAADAVTVSTPFLAKRIRERFGVRTILLRNGVDARAFTPNLVRPVTTGLIVGWVGALAYRSRDLETMRGVLDRYLDAVDGTFVHHGTFPTDTDTAAERVGLPPHRAGPTLQARPPWDYPDLLTGMDIGIVPLSDQPFNHAKSWIKGLEYAAAGIPFVAQATPEYVELAARGAGLAADSPGRWRDCLDALTDPATRASLRETGLAVARDHDINHRWRDWETVYGELLSRAS